MNGTNIREIQFSTVQYMWIQGYRKLIKTTIMLKDMKTFLQVPYKVLARTALRL
jgi:hypothetical protein